MTAIGSARALSAIYPVRLRADLPRHVADEYWAGPHAELMRRCGHILEYNQHHFSDTDHGYWPATDTVGTHPASLFKWDGLTEVRFRNRSEMARAAYGTLGTIFHDEQNVFDNVLGHICSPRGATRWTRRHDSTVPHRTVLLLRRRRGVPYCDFRAFVHARLGITLHSSGALDVRAYTFVPISGITHRTPGLSHAYPPSHRHHGAVIFGWHDHKDLAALLATPKLRAIVSDQARTITAVHAYTVERTVPVIAIPEVG